jgi:glycosyltransferase involved in cell wall biosynthesis
LLVRAIRGVLGQRYPGSVECLVAFDRTEPQHLAVHVPEGRELRALVNDRTPGPAGARNTAALAATGELLAFCDDDDVWLPDKLRLQVEALLADSTASAATCGIVLESRGRTFIRVPLSERIALHDLLASRLAWLHTSSLVARRDAYLGDIGPLDEAIPGSYGEDYDWVLRAARLGPIVAVRQPLVTVSWDQRSFADRWETNIEALRYLLAKHPDLDRHNVARISGQIAFASAALGRRRDAARWAWSAADANWAEPRAYISLLVAFAGLPPSLVLRALAVAGRAI